MAEKKKTLELDTFVENMNRKGDKLNGLKVQFHWTKRKVKR